MTEIPFAAVAGTVLHCWMRPADGAGPCMVRLRDGSGAVREISLEGARDFTFCEAVIASPGPALLSWQDGTLVGVAYAFDPAQVTEDGIDILFVGPEARHPETGPSVHFRPPFGWMNDPNGLCRTAGFYHLFYQHYPCTLSWNTMHWGHAVSRDLVRWTHLPVFLFPSAAVLADNRAGGAFSGSATGGPGAGLRVFYTDHDNGRGATPEVQFTAVSTDGVAAGPSEAILAPADGLASPRGDFRDPFVLPGPDGRLKMLVGSGEGDAGRILLYDTDDPDGRRGWTFVGVLHRDGDHGTKVAECPWLVPLPGDGHEPPRWALGYCADRSIEPATGRPNLAHVLVGRFDGRVFDAEAARELDFVGDCYAFQAFSDSEGPVGIGWLANWNDVDRALPFPTAMTVPRSIAWRDGSLRFEPIAALAARRGQRSDMSSGLEAGVRLPEAPSDIEIELATAGASMRLVFDHPTIPLALVQDGRGVTLEHGRAGGGPVYRAEGAAGSRFRIILDAGSIEIFVDGGRWVGSKRLADPAWVRSVRLEGRTAVKEAALWPLQEVRPRRVRLV